MANDLGNPSYSLSIGGAPLDELTLRYVLSLELEESLTEMDMMVLRVQLPESAAEDTRLRGIFKLGAAFTASISYGTGAIRQAQGDIVERSFRFGSGMTRELVIRGLDGLYRLQQKRFSRYWNGPLNTIATTIAGEHGMTATVTGVPSTPAYEFQNNERNGSFLRRIAFKAGLSLECIDGALLLEPASLPPEPLTIPPSALLDYEVRHQLYDIPTKVTVRGWDIRTNAAVTGTSVSGQLQKVSGGTSGPDLVMTLFGENNLEVDNAALDTASKCTDMANSILQDRAFGLVTGAITLRGVPDLISGKKVNLKGIGLQSGAYMIGGSAHRFDARGGYVTTIRLTSDSLCSTDLG
ncbi:MAG: phage late control D family protein [Myxococcota bacterium]